MGVAFDMRRAMMGQNSLVEATATGNPAVFNTTVARPLVHTLIGMEPVQAGSGDPSPQNIRAISGWQGVKAWRTGVNVWDGVTETGRIDTTTGETTVNNTSQRTAHFVPVSPSTKYYAVSPNNNNLFIIEYDIKQQFVRYASYYRNEAWTTNGATHYIKFYSTVVDGLSGVSINYPYTATAYAPYSGESVEVTFPAEAGTVYGGTVDLATGTLTVTHAKKLASEATNWRSLTALDNGTGYYIYAPNFFPSNVDGNAISNVYKFVTKPWEKLTFGEANATASAIVTVPPETNTLELATEYIATIGVYFVYPLTEPITYHLTPQQITALIGDNVLWSDTNADCTVTYLKKK